MEPVVTGSDWLSLWVAIVVIAVGTWSFRSSFVVLLGYLDETPPWFERVTRFIPPALFAAFIVPDVFVIDASLALELANERLLAAIVAATVAWYTENMFATIATGMVVLWTLTFLA